MAVRIIDGAATVFDGAAVLHNTAIGVIADSKTGMLYFPGRSKSYNNGVDQLGNELTIVFAWGTKVQKKLRRSKRIAAQKRFEKAAKKGKKMKVKY